MASIKPSGWRGWGPGTIGALVVIAALGTSGVAIGGTNDSGLHVGASGGAPAVRRGVATRVPAWLTLTGTSVGPVPLGATAGDVVPFLEASLGPVAGVDRQHLEGVQEPSCFDGNELAAYKWRGATFTFVGDAGTPFAGYTLFDFRVDGTAASDAVLGFQSTRGARVGDSVGRWRALHPDATFFPAESDFSAPSIVLSDALIAVADPSGARIISLTTVPPNFCE